MLSKYIYADSSKDIENIIGDLLKEKKLTLSTAESCTGGLIADRLTNIPGSSAFFLGGIIAYSNDVKISDLGVSEKILNKKGAVSSDVAKDMAKGIRQKYNTNIGLSTTGIAGPEGGSIDKPVGLVYIGLSTEDREESFKFNFSISRKKNKLMFSQGALNILREYLSWPESNLEKLEGLEQLRFLSENKKVKCVEVSSRGNVFWELNNPEDVQRIEKVIS